MPPRLVYVVPADPPLPTQLQSSTSLNVTSWAGVELGVRMEAYMHKVLGWIHIPRQKKLILKETWFVSDQRKFCVLLHTLATLGFFFVAFYHNGSQETLRSCFRTLALHTVGAEVKETFSFLHSFELPLCLIPEAAKCQSNSLTFRELLFSVASNR